MNNFDFTNVFKYRKQKVMMTLWNEKTQLLTEEVITDDEQDQKIIIITSTRVTQYGGNIYLHFILLT